MRIYFIGIAGAGMHSLAYYLSEAGHEISGSDPGADAATCALWAERGCDVHKVQCAENIHDVDMVVYSSAIPASNPERMAAERLGLACSRGQALAYFANQHPCSIAVCGTHGKGTTAAAVSDLLLKHGCKTGDILGAVPIGRKQPARFVPGSDYLVCEVDESDRTHLMHRPGILLINNVEADHLNQYKDLDDIVQSFGQLVRHCLKHGTKVVIHYAGVGAPLLYRELADNDAIYWVAPEYVLANAAGHVRHYRISAPDHNGRCDLTWFDGHGGSMRLTPLLGGYANAQNMASAAMVGELLGISLDEIADTLARYQGLKDRCQIQAFGGISLVTDYASHPTCVKNDIAWIRARSRRVVVIYHPYRYTLMQCHWADLVQALSAADEVFLLPFDPCGEPPVDHISSPDMAKNIMQTGGQASAFDSFESCISAAIQSLSDGDSLVIFAGHPAFEMAADRLRHRS